MIKEHTKTSRAKNRKNKNSSLASGAFIKYILRIMSAFQICNDLNGRVPVQLTQELWSQLVLYMEAPIFLDLGNSKIDILLPAGLFEILKESRSQKAISGVIKDSAKINFTIENQAVAYKLSDFSPVSLSFDRALQLQSEVLMKDRIQREYSKFSSKK